MNLQDYIEVAHNFEPIVVKSSAAKVSQLKTLFQDKVKSLKLVPPKQIYNLSLDGKEYLVYQLYVEMADQAVFAYCIEATDKNIEIHVRRFEKANVAGKALWSIAKNIFGGQPRTLQKEANLIKNVGKLSKGLTSSSPLGKDALYWADEYFGRMNKKLHEALLEI